MIATIPMAALAPLEYRSALDAARMLLASETQILIQCEAAVLMPEVLQRFGKSSAQPQAALWVEPDQSNWTDIYHALAQQLPPGAHFLILTSLPAARLLPERRQNLWRNEAVGLQPAGLKHLYHMLRHANCHIQAIYGFHTPSAVGYGLLAQVALLLKRPDLADRLRFTARMHYMVTGRLAQFATVALLHGRIGGRYA